MLNMRQLKERYQNNISFRYLSIASIFLIVIQLTFGAMQSYRLYQQEINDISKQVQSKIEIFQSIASEDIFKSDPIVLEKVLKNINKDRDIVYSVIVDQNRKILVNSLKQDNSFVKLALQTSNDPNNHMMSCSIFLSQPLSGCRPSFI